MMFVFNCLMPIQYVLCPKIIDGLRRFELKHWHLKFDEII